MMSGRGDSQKVFSDVEAALAWMVPRIPAVDGTRSDFATATSLVERARAAIPRPAPQR